VVNPKLAGKIPPAALADMQASEQEIIAGKIDVTRLASATAPAK